LTAQSIYSMRTAPMPRTYYFASKGMLLHARQNGGLPIVTVNVAEVDIQFLRVKNERLSDFLDRVITHRKSNRQQGEEEDSSGSNDDAYDFRRTSLHGAVGFYQLDDFRNIAEGVYLGRFPAERQPNRRSGTYIPVEEIGEDRKSVV